jgi:succinate-semialdehyde dehydrogenase/glutarate-semialdehyde dehydrogenase
MKKTQTNTNLVSMNPATLEPVGEVPVTPAKQVSEMVQNGRNAFPGWRDMGLSKRAEILKRSQQLLLERSEEFGRLITLEMGRPLTESMTLELNGSIDVIGYYANRGHAFLDDRRVPLHHLLFKRRKSSIHLEPLGVLGIISPWNWPLLIPLGGIIPALLAGNCVVFKHSELTPLMAVKIRDLLLESGVPESAFQIVLGGAEQGKALVDAPVEKIFFTGSTEVGLQVLQQASRTLKKSVLEMGGSDPAIVCEDADSEITSSGLVWGGFSNCGQNCNAIERIYVHEKIAQPLIDRIIEKTKRLRVGDGMETGTDIGPLASEAQRIKTEALVEMAVEMGARVLLGGKRERHLPGYFYQPTVILWEKSVPQPVDVELFGPIIYITPVASDEEAVQLANRSSFGLAASVWTENPRKGLQIARRIESGTVMINDSIVSFGMTEAGWTGIKNSGIGWVHGKKGLDEMVNIKYINRDPQSRTQNFWWFPYTLTMFSSIKAGLDFMFAKTIVKRLRAVPTLLKEFTGFVFLNRPRKHKL